MLSVHPSLSRLHRAGLQALTGPLLLHCAAFRLLLVEGDELLIKEGADLKTVRGHARWRTRFNTADRYTHADTSPLLCYAPHDPTFPR